MKRVELNTIIKAYFKHIADYLDGISTSFDISSIENFRREVKKLKVFLHLTAMESKDGLSVGITQKMRKIYGCMGVIVYVLQQLECVRQFSMNHPENIPDEYLKTLEKESQFWKTTGEEISANYSFLIDEKIVLSSLPDELAQKSIQRFVHYTLFEIQLTSHSTTANSLDNIRKFMEDIHYNFLFIAPFLSDQLRNLLNGDDTGEFLRFSDSYQERRKQLQHLQSYLSEKLYDNEFSSLKMMEAEWINDLKSARKQVIAKLNSMKILNYNFNGPVPTAVSGD